MRKSPSKKPLDRIDCGIVRELSENARLSNKELAAKVGLSPSSCLERVKRLREAGVLRGFHADVDPRAVGIHLEALTSVRLERHRQNLFEQFLEHARGLDEVVAVYQVAGVDDFLVHVAVRDPDHLSEFIHEKMSSHPAVAHMHTSLIFRSVRCPILPQYV